MNENYIKINIGADFAPTQYNEKYFCAGNINKIIGAECYKQLLFADLNIFNLETPLTNTESPILKCGPNLIAPTKAISTYSKIPNLLLGLANNHIMDQDVQGLESTINVLKQNGVDYCGAGENLGEASKGKIIEIKNKIVGIYACAEHEFSIADENTPGANPFDLLESFGHVRELKKKCDYIIVLYHGGKEYYRYPSPDLQKYCRKFIENGADLIVCQHTHCIGSRENYKAGTIIYGQGDFLLDINEDNEYVHSSILLDVCINRNLSVSEIPLVKTGKFVKKASVSESNRIMNEYVHRSQNVSDEIFIKKQYAKFANDMMDSYLMSILGSNIIFRVLNKLLGGKIGNLLYNKKSILKIYNIIFCEAHRELLLKGLKNKYSKW